MNNDHAVFSKAEEIIDRLDLIDIYCIEQGVQAELTIL